MDLTTDLGDKVAEIEGLVDKRLKLGSLRFTYTQLVGAFALLSTIVGSLYGGFLMYQKVEGIANLDLGAIQSAMTSTSADVLRVEEVAKEIKISLPVLNNFCDYVELPSLSHRQIFLKKRALIQRRPWPRRQLRRQALR